MRAEQNPLWFAGWFKEHRPDDYAFVSDHENTKTIKRSLSDLLELRESLQAELASLAVEAAA